MFHIANRRRRAVASLVLGAWMFALVASLAHACGFAEELGIDRPVAAALPEGGHGDPEGAAPPGCKQFCGDGISALAKLKTFQDQPNAQTLLPLSWLGEVRPTNAAAPALLHPKPTPSLAVNIRFVRLAL
jgi:hypothetical protein